MSVSRVSGFWVNMIVDAALIHTADSVLGAVVDLITKMRLDKNPAFESFEVITVSNEAFKGENGTRRYVFRIVIHLVTPIANAAAKRLMSRLTVETLQTGSASPALERSSDHETV